ncbi:hypothetical protein [Planococcus lenghuensis]|uniref:Uncharacterized protein n=1 Tax=Planococcus lenghuensis TaxID=2213202 RepID=A0A1Q2L4L7_9BACL|nr:hypothetical protein [Planococcus lenghuensis]AQQ55366.1 hypothetical protein B0X71_19535 [Planococcus lenghuensis]
MAVIMGCRTDEQAWNELPFQTEEALSEYVNGRVDTLPVGMGVHLFFNDGLLTPMEDLPFNLDLHFKWGETGVYGNIAAAAQDEEGRIQPLTEEQVKFIQASSILVPECRLFRTALVGGAS